MFLYILFPDHLRPSAKICGETGMSIYSASKFALRGYSLTIAHDDINPRVVVSAGV